LRDRRDRHRRAGSRRRGIIATGLPVFAAGVTPNSSARSGPGTVGFPVVLGQVAIAPGDVVVGDRDGAVVVPRASAGAVAGRLAAVRAAESAFSQDVAGGLRIPGFIDDLLASDQVRYADRTASR
jgi:4-hydroxy-4-methyl-2-oxoglutarate aldolase